MRLSDSAAGSQPRQAPMNTRVRVHVDPRLCEGHGLCLQLAPDVFDITDDEIAFCVERPDPHHLDHIKAAVAACPRQAISVADEDHDPAKDRQ